MNPKKKRLRRRKRTRLLIVLLVAIAGAVGLFNRSRAANLETVKVLSHDYMAKIDSKGILILNEKTYTAQGEGVVDYSVRDGERVPKDFVVANLSLMTDVSELKDELLKIQSAIEHKNQNLNPSNQNYELGDKEINLITTIQDSLVKEEMSGVLEAIETLELNTKKNVDITEISSLINLSNQELEDRRDQLSKEIATNNIVYKSETSGIVTYKVDRLEEVYTREIIPDLSYDFIKTHPALEPLGQKNQVATGEPLYKIVDNFEYYLAIPIDNISEIKSVKDPVTLIINSTIELKGKILEKNKTGNTGVLVVSLNDKLTEVGLDRQVDVSLVKEKSKSYIIPTKSIVESNKISGVYVLELNGIVKFRPIEIIKQLEDQTIVSTGDAKGQIILRGDKTARTVTVFDQIIKDPSNIEEGQIIR